MASNLSEAELMKKEEERLAKALQKPAITPAQRAAQEAERKKKAEERKKKEEEEKRIREEKRKEELRLKEEMRLKANAASKNSDDTFDLKTGSQPAGKRLGAYNKNYNAGLDSFDGSSVNDLNDLEFDDEIQPTNISQGRGGSMVKRGGGDETNDLDDLAFD